MGANRLREAAPPGDACLLRIRLFEPHYAAVLTYAAFLLAVAAEVALLVQSAPPSSIHRNLY